MHLASVEPPTSRDQLLQPLTVSFTDPMAFHVQTWVVPFYFTEESRDGAVPEDSGLIDALPYQMVGPSVHLRRFWSIGAILEQFRGVSY